jgi:hypothetical protein
MPRERPATKGNATMIRITKAQLRDVLKQAFYEGFVVARQGTQADAWEHSITRIEFDHHSTAERLMEAAKVKK